MGVNLSDLVEKEEISLNFLAGKKIGVDSFNVLYQFLASIRGMDGLPLSDSHGNVTSHLAGLFYRTTPSELKQKTLIKRKQIRVDAMDKSIKALKEGAIGEAKKFGSRALKLTPEMISDAKELLKYLGIPYVDAPSEGEAQASVMASKGQLFGVASQDFDCLLFGANNLFRYVGVTGKRKVAGKNFYVDVKPQRVVLENVLSELKISREKLIWLGILIGTDFNEKFPKIGPKTALKLVQEKNSFEEIIAQVGYEPEFDYNEVVELFLRPKSVEVSDREIELKEVQRNKVIDFLVGKHDFSKERVSSTLDAFIRKKEEVEKQKNLGQWF